MKVVNLESQDSIISNYMAELRDCHVQQGRLLFRENLRRIARLMAYEISKTLDYAPQLVHTPLADRNVRTMNERLVVGTVLRAGLAFHEGFLDVFDKADAGFVAAYREEGTKENIRIQLDYLAAPHLEGFDAVFYEFLYFFRLNRHNGLCLTCYCSLWLLVAHRVQQAILLPAVRGESLLCFLRFAKLGEYSCR